MSVAKKLTTVAQNMSKVYAAGKEAGVQSEYDRFWDAFQNYGKRTNYQYGFAGRGWTDDTFAPKYPIAFTSTNANYALMNSRVEQSPYLLALDFSGCVSAIRIFAESTVEELGVLDFSNVIAGWNGLQQTFCACYSLRKIEKLILPKKSAQLTAFDDCKSLVDVTFQGTAYQNLFLRWSPLSKASIESAFSVLSDDVSGTTVSFNLNAVNTAFETSEGAADGSESEEWLALVATKPNWTINLV